MTATPQSPDVTRPEPVPPRNPGERGDPARPQHQPPVNPTPGPGGEPPRGQDEKRK